MSIQINCSYIALFIYLWCVCEMNRAFQMGITLHPEIYFNSLRLFFFNTFV